MLKEGGSSVGSRGGRGRVAEAGWRGRGRGLWAVTGGKKQDRVTLPAPHSAAVRSLGSRVKRGGPEAREEAASFETALVMTCSRRLAVRVEGSGEIVI